MHMKNRLPCSLVYVDADVVTVRMEAFINFLFHILKHYIHGFSFMVGELEVGGDMTFGNNQRMTGGDWIAIVESYTSGCLANDFHASGETAERAFFPFLSRQFVEMIVLI